MPQPSADQTQMANEVLAGTREISGSTNVIEPPNELDAATKQQLYDINLAIAPHMEQVAHTGETRSLEAVPDLANKQWTFERGVVAEDIQKTNDIKSPGE